MSIHFDKNISILIEGLDGIGKTSTIERLKNLINGKIIQTPPQIIKPYRKLFENAATDKRMTYYMIGNLISGTNMIEELNNSSIVVDRFYPSTISYIIGKSDEELPTIDNEVYKWPEELYKPDYMFVLTMNESDRVERLKNRMIERNENLTIEDNFIMSNSLISERINQVYRNIGCIEIKINKSDSTDEICNKIINYINCSNI